MSGGLAPSRSTVYIGNLPYSLTNNDLHKVFEKYGRVVKVTIVKDRVSRKSKGVAFVLFLKKEDAQTCSSSLNGQELFGRRIKCSIAKDNGRSAEFIRRRNYPDKQRCYECGEEGHLSYSCSRNALGEREPPPKKERKRKKKNLEKKEEEFIDSDDDYTFHNNNTNFNTSHDEDNGDDEVKPDLETLSAAIKHTQEQLEKDRPTQEENPQPVRKKIKRSTYFSDEEDYSD